MSYNGRWGDQITMAESRSFLLSHMHAPQISRALMSERCLDRLDNRLRNGLIAPLVVSVAVTGCRFVTERSEATGKGPTEIPGVAEHLKNAEKLKMARTTIRIDIDRRRPTTSRRRRTLLWQDGIHGSARLRHARSV
jgi:hypothetical protein